MRLIFRAFVSVIRLLFYKYVLRMNIEGINPRIAFDKMSDFKIEKGGCLYFAGMFVARKNLDISISNTGNLIIGDKVFVNANCVISAHDKIEIGDRVQFGPGCLIFDNDHDYKKPPKERAVSFNTAPIYIGQNSWIGAGSIILKGSYIGENCVIGAGSVIKGNIPANSVVIQKRNNHYLSKEDE